MRLREIRKSKKMTVPQLSNESGVPVRTIEDIERKGECKVSTAIKLADALEVTLDELCRNFEKHFTGFDDKAYIIYEADILEDGSIKAQAWDMKKSKWTYAKTEKKKKEFLEKAKKLSCAIIL